MLKIIITLCVIQIVILIYVAQLLESKFERVLREIKYQETRIDNLVEAMKMTNNEKEEKNFSRAVTQQQVDEVRSRIN